MEVQQIPYFFQVEIFKILLFKIIYLRPKCSLLLFLEFADQDHQYRHRFLVELFLISLQSPLDRHRHPKHQ